MRTFRPREEMVIGGRYEYPRKLWPCSSLITQWNPFCTPLESRFRTMSHRFLHTSSPTPLEEIVVKNIDLLKQDRGRVYAVRCMCMHVQP